ncbi:transposable element Tcb1 transposase [Trichonephila clavipes]|nr:transposable element Tcb1 transposase [Trichonephila clavipes]
MDGTWQKRGYSSHNGCVSCISIDTGKVLDIEIMSHFCRMCSKKAKVPDAASNAHVCCNHMGSASRMFYAIACRPEFYVGTQGFRTLPSRGTRKAHSEGSIKQVGITLCVISRLWQPFKYDGNISRRYNTDHPRVTPNENLCLTVTPKRSRHSRESDLSRQLYAATGTTVSKQTVDRRLGHIGLYARRLLKCV